MIERIVEQLNAHEHWQAWLATLGVGVAIQMARDKAAN